MKYSIYLLVLYIFLSDTLFAQDGAYRPEIKNREVKEVTIQLPFHKKISTIKVVVVDGIAVLQGDIELGPIDKLLRSSVVAVDGSSNRWSGGRIPFTFTLNFTPTEIENVNRAIKMLNDETNLYLFPRTNEPDYIIFERLHTKHSSSPIGREGGGQTIKLGDNMSKVGIIVHEILHSAGLFHEQSREDRDDYIKILWENIEPGEGSNFFKEDDRSTDIGPYNYCSIMHYGKHAFGKVVNGAPLQTIECKMLCDCINAHSNRDSLTTTDIAGINSIYPSRTSIPWIIQPGSNGKDITVNENGIVYLVNTIGKIYRFNGTSWFQMPGSDAINIASNAKKTCIVNTAGKIYHLVNGGWVQMPGSDAYDIAINDDGIIWMVNTVGKIYKFDGVKWIQMPGSDGKRISAGGGQVWLTNTRGKIYKFDGIKWMQMPGSSARDIAVGNDGAIWLTNTIGNIYKWNGAAWSQIYGSDGVRISANPNKAMLINSVGKIYQLEY